MNLVFESEWTNFSEEAESPVAITYSSSGIEYSGVEIPKIEVSRIEFLGKEGEMYGFPEQYDGYGREILKPYFIKSVENTVLVYKPEDYVFSGQFKLYLYD